MALRNQPYIPLYVQDFLTDEKLIECSASATGVYIRIMCIMHKSEPYGTILLKQKDKQSDKQILNFALKLLKSLPYDLETIQSGLEELISENVLQIEGDKLLQKRMIKDFTISIKRAEAGKKGGEKTQFAKAKVKANDQANTEYEDEYENEIDYENVIELYHSLCPKMSKVEKLTDQRKGFVHARMSEFGIEKVTTVLRTAGESDFLNGKNDRAWKADFEWIMRPTNFVKILEGKYSNKRIEFETDEERIKRIAGV